MIMPGCGCGGRQVPTMHTHDQLDNLRLHVLHLMLSTLTVRCYRCHCCVQVPWDVVVLASLGYQVGIGGEGTNGGGLEQVGPVERECGFGGRAWSQACLLAQVHLCIWAAAAAMQ
jgi:hypothetical protein